MGAWRITNYWTSITNHKITYPKTPVITEARNISPYIPQRVQVLLGEDHGAGQSQNDLVEGPRGASQTQEFVELGALERVS